MIETFLIDLPVFTLFGSIYALLQRKEGVSPLKEKGLWYGLVFSTVFLISVILSYAIAPDWMWMYFPENPRINLLDWIYLILFLYYLPFAGGYLLTRELRKRNFIAGSSVAILSLLAEVFIVLRLWDRYTHVGTREEFLSGTAALLWKSPVNTVFNFTIPVMVIIFIASFILLRREAAS